MIKVPKFKKASQAATWIADTISKKTWCKRDLARDTNNNSVKVKSPEAVQFCSVGFIEKANQGYNTQLKLALREVLLHTMYSKADIKEFEMTPKSIEIEDWNDEVDRTPAQVRATFRQAAKLLAIKEKASKVKAKKAKVA